MLNSQRIFVEAISKYGAEHGIAVEIRAAGWLIVMQRGGTRHLAFGYDLGLNSAVAHRIANDKSATADVLTMSGVPCVPHALFLDPELNAYVPTQGSWQAMLTLLSQNPAGIAVKPNEGTSGKSVFLVSSAPGLELAVNRIFASHASLAISPYLEIEEEVRVVLLDDIPLLVYSKKRPSVIGDGKRSLLELALATLPADQRSAVLPEMFAELDRNALDAVVPEGARRVLNWRHNLESGARPLLLEHGEARDACVALAVRAAQAIGIRFASIDIVRVEGGWQVLEINSGVMTEALSKLHPELVHAAYRAALDKVFA
ncbi:RimK-like protein [Bradyrhizobium sp. ARR65]|uniref:ATP-grasp domain-containing protein n=1 Tax=Bradyrhizobium sp. ARR65 TaxID=1040989 RepID=UPI0004633776|nr:RimK-like protein [Bradyrhizobium sp. ARR65]